MKKGMVKSARLAIDALIDDIEIDMLSDRESETLKGKIVGATLAKNLLDELADDMIADGVIVRKVAIGVEYEAHQISLKYHRKQDEMPKSEEGRLDGLHMALQAVNKRRTQ